ncbi:hypothetical protein GCM10010401_02070 [Rarobacter faecitabidus]
MATAFIVLAGLILTSGHAAATPRTETPAAAVAGDTLHSLGVAAPSTAHTPSLRTWWHMNAEANADVPVAAQNVRQSTFYTVKVASDTARATWYDSFTYLTIPRSGKGKPGYEDPADGGYHQDGAENVWENAEEIGGTNAHHTMSWTTFEYAAATWVDVHLATGESVQSIDDVQLRPRNLDFVRYLVNSSTVRILVPYSPDGYRFSVEFAPQLTEVVGANRDYWHSAPAQPDVSVGRMIEPRNAMIVFAEAIPSGDEAQASIPGPDDGEIYRPTPGEIRNLHTVNADVLYFEPGTYHMGADYRAVLNPRVRWIYFAPGAYVKGAFEFPSNAATTSYKITGFGVLSGEQYVYEADTRNPGFTRRDPSQYSDCHAACVKPLRFDSASGVPQTLDLQGVTIAEPPYHSFVVYGDESSFAMNVRNYHQVGAWYWQTDGLELYDGSTMRDSFIHANDDVLKIYHSNVTIDNTVVWKGPNGPVIQWGWVPRNIANVRVSRTYVIHNQMQWDTINTCVLNSSRHWDFSGDDNRASRAANIANVTIEDTYVEGAVNCMARIYALSNTSDLTIKGMYVDGWVEPGTRLASHLTADKDSTQSSLPVVIGTNPHGVTIQNYAVGNAYVESRRDDGGWGNWHDNKLGRLYVGLPWESWDVYRASGAPDVPFPTGSAAGLTDPCGDDSVNHSGLNCPDDPDPCDAAAPGCGEPCGAADCPGGPDDNDPKPGGPSTAPVKISSKTIPTLTGTARVGKRLRATSGTWSQPGVTVRYQWLRAGKPIAGATGAAYTLKNADAGKLVRVRVSATKPGYASGNAQSAPRRGAKALTKVTVKRSAARAGARHTIRVRIATAATKRPAGKLRVRIGNRLISVKVRAKDRGRVTVVSRATAGRARVTAKFTPAKKLARYTTRATSRRVTVTLR